MKMKRNIQPCWMEVRPLASGKFEARNFSSVLDYLHNVGKPFRFFAVSCPSDKVEGLRTVRLFLQVAGADIAERLANALKSSLDVEVIIGSEPPSNVYPCCAEFMLKGYNASPVCQPKERPEVNPVDVLIGTLGRSKTALEVLSIEDRKARREILGYIAKKQGRSASFAGSLVNVALEIPSAFFGSPPKKSAVKDLDPFTKTRVDAAGWKAGQNLFRCELRAYGDEDIVEALSDALPSSPLNRFRKVRKLRDVKAPSKELTEPKGRELKKLLLSYLWAVPLILFLYLWIMLGAVDPLRLANVDLFAIILTASSATVLWALFQKPEPLILSTDELSLIVGMPSAVGKLPVEIGTARTTRERFTITPPPTEPHLKPA